MNIQTDAIIVNQCERHCFEEFKYEGSNIRWLSFAERGVGLGRNTALMRAKADICLFADDDVMYVNEYKDIIIEEFKNRPGADVIVFNVLSSNENKKVHIIKKEGRIRFYNCLRYSTVKVAARTDSLKKYCYGCESDFNMV